MRKIQWQLISEKRMKRNPKRKIKRAAAAAAVDITSTRVAEIDLERIDIIDQAETTIDTNQLVDVRDRLKRDPAEMIDTVAADAVQDPLAPALDPLHAAAQDRLVVATNDCTEIKRNLLNLANSPESSSQYLGFASIGLIHVPCITSHYYSKINKPQRNMAAFYRMRCVINHL